MGIDIFRCDKKDGRKLLHFSGVYHGVKGRNVSIEGLSLDGALVVDCIDDAEVKVEGSIQNEGWIMENVDHKDTSLLEEIQIRGFKMNKIEQLEQRLDQRVQFPTHMPTTIQR